MRESSPHEGGSGSKTTLLGRAGLGIRERMAALLSKVGLFLFFLLSLLSWSHCFVIFPDG